MISVQSLSLAQLYFNCFIVSWIFNSGKVTFLFNRNNKLTETSLILQTSQDLSISLFVVFHILFASIVLKSAQLDS